MSDQFSKLTWLNGLAGADLTDGEYRVLVAIFNHTDASGRKCYAGQTTLAAETGRSDRQVRRIIPELIRKGWLVEVRKGSSGGRAGLASEFDLNTPEHRTPVSAVPKAVPAETPDTRDRCSDGTPDISGKNTGHLEQEHRTFRVRTPDTSVLPTDPLSDPATEPDQVSDGEDDPQRESEPDVYESVSSSLNGISEPGNSEPDIFESVSSLGTDAHFVRITDPFASASGDASAQEEDEPQSESEPDWGSVSLFGPPESAPAEHFTPWPTGKPLPIPRDPFTTYVDETTGEPIPV